MYLRYGLLIIQTQFDTGGKNRALEKKRRRRKRNRKRIVLRKISFNKKFLINEFNLTP